MHWIDQKYVLLLSNRLPLFKKVGNTSYNCRCILCGDSKKNKTRARGYLLGDSKGTRYFCHNCGASLSLKKFLGQVDPLLEQQYSQEKFFEKRKEKVSHTPLPAPDVTIIEKPDYLKAFGSLKKISQLPPTHKAKRYIEQRLIPSKFHYKIFFAQNFAKFVNEIIPNKLNEKNQEERIILPFLTREKKLIGFTGRSLDNNSLRYITIMIDTESPKLFGIDTVDFQKKIYITEGPIDSFFIENGIAMGGSDMSKSFKALDVEPKKCVMIFDNEPRNKEIVTKISKAIDQGFNVFIWPEKIKCKDLNELALDGYIVPQIKKLVDDHTSCGIEAKLKLQSWKRI